MMIQLYFLKTCTCHLQAAEMAKRLKELNHRVRDMFGVEGKILTMLDEGLPRRAYGFDIPKDIYERLSIQIRMIPVAEEFSDILDGDDFCDGSGSIAEIMEKCGEMVRGCDEEAED